MWLLMDRLVMLSAINSSRCPAISMTATVPFQRVLPAEIPHGNALLRRGP